MPEGKRNRRTKEQIIADLDSKIKYHKNAIQKLEEKKEKASRPATRNRKPGINTLTSQLKEKKVDPQKAIEALTKAGLL